MAINAISNHLARFVGERMKRAAPAQGGLFSGDNPSHYNASDPIRLWVIQVVIIISMTQLLSLILGRIRQPRVIAEVIGGVILGPTVMGRIPGFKAAIFPDASMPLLTLTSTIGLVLFLFLVGLEIDARVIKRNAKASSAISIAGLIIPLGLGAALGVIMYHKFIDPSVNFGYFLLFTAVAVGITAFPVLCRILTELRLLDTNVGVVVLSAGIGNDVVGWILLALTVALVNASDGLTALWVLLASVGYVIVLLYPGKWAFKWLARRTGSLETGQPTAFMMTVTILVVFISAFFTDVIGVHAIFGGFLAGLIIPHENGFAIALVEKFEDLVCILFLPLYFALSGLRTNLGLLNTGETWGYTILICVFAFFSKFLACAGTAKLLGFNIRESGAIGSLMSCKGLVELIVLNIGLQAHILDTRTFSMFVVHALVLTFMTTPLTILFYPPEHRVHGGQVRDAKDGADEGAEPKHSEDDVRTKFAVVLDKIEQLSSAMKLTQLLQPPSATSSGVSISSSSSDEKAAEAGIPTLPRNALVLPKPPMTIDALRLIELTDRTSAVLKSQAADDLLQSDPVVSVFRTFGYLNRLPVSAALSVVAHNEFPSSVANHVRESGSQMVILPWTRAASSATDDSTGGSTTTHNPFDGIFKQSTGQSSVVYSEFVRKLFMNSPCDVALFVDHGVSSNKKATYEASSNQHLFLPFFGGPDDRLALSFVVQLCNNASITATVVRIDKTESHDLSPTTSIDNAKAAAHLTIASQHNTVGVQDTVYGHRDTQTRLQSDTADNIIWDRYSRPSDSHGPALSDALSRITFSKEGSPKPLHSMLEATATVIAEHSKYGRTPVVVIGRSRRMAVESHKAELRLVVQEKGAVVGNEVARTLGDVGAALVAAGTNASLLVMQASV